ncbi:MAG: hypothetical protein RLZZ189_1951 [Pseudomonadota bacterium]|jgi:hypothetical protein
MKVFKGRHFLRHISVAALREFKFPDHRMMNGFAGAPEA